MTRLLIKKYVNESCWLWLACGLLIFVFSWARVWIVCQFDLEQFGPLLKQFKPFERFSPVPLEQFLTFAGSIAMTFQEPVMVLGVFFWSLSRGSDVISGELGRGTLEILLSRPISRTRLLATHACLSTLGLFLLCLLAWSGIAVGIHTNSIQESVRPTAELQLPWGPVSVPIPLAPAEQVRTPLADRVSPALYGAPSANLFGFGFVLLAFSSMCSCIDRYRWRTIGVVLAAYVVQLLLFLLSKATEAASIVGYASFLSLYQPDGMVQVVRNRPDGWSEILSAAAIPGWQYQLGPAGMNLALVSIGILCYLCGWWQLCRRDLPAPL